MEYEERELILELFPGTSPDLLPLGEILYYRDEEGRVVEHWDVIQDIPEKAANANGMF